MRIPRDKYSKAAIQGAILNVERINERIEAFRFSMWAPRDMRMRPQTTEVSQASNTIFMHLYQQLTEAYRDLFMMGLFLTEDEQQEIRHLAMDKFLAEKYDIERLMDVDSDWAPDDFRDNLEFLKKRKELQDQYALAEAFDADED